MTDAEIELIFVQQYMGWRKQKTAQSIRARFVSASVAALSPSDDLLSRLLLSLTTSTRSSMALLMFDWASRSDDSLVSTLRPLCGVLAVGEGGNGTVSAVVASVETSLVTIEGILEVVALAALRYMSRQYVDGNDLLSGLMMGSVTLGMCRRRDIGCCCITADVPGIRLVDELLKRPAWLDVVAEASPLPFGVALVLAPLVRGSVEGSLAASRCWSWRLGSGLDASRVAPLRESLVSVCALGITEVRLYES